MRRKEAHMPLMSGISNMMLLYSVDEKSNKMKKLNRKASDKKRQGQSRRTSNSYVGMLASSGIRHLRGDIECVL
ncbi:MAG: hypothetical protein ACOC3C_00765 [Candidatus Thorarchaeota archaeon]